MTARVIDLPPLQSIVSQMLADLEAKKLLLPHFPANSTGDFCLWHSGRHRIE